jgi:hypothetical protein
MMKEGAISQQCCSSCSLAKAALMQLSCLAGCPASVTGASPSDTAGARADHSSKAYAQLPS